MTTTRSELADLASALRKALGADAAGGQPTVDERWRSRWPTLTELGVTALCVSTEADGFGDEVPAALVVSRELGAALHGSPYPAAVGAAYALSRWLPAEVRDPLIGQVLAGEHLPTIAHLDADATISGSGDDLRVVGRARLVAGAADADSFLLLPAAGDEMLFVPRSDRCALDRVEGFDTTRSCADVRFSGADARPLAAPAGGRTAVELRVGLLLAGDALGGLDRMLARTVEYARGRAAFGKVIGGFQAVQHRLVDHTVRLRGMSLLAEEAAARLAAGDPEAGRRVLAAEAAVGGAAVPALHDLLQLTGAIGFTWEYGLHHYERRAHLDARLGRNPRRALRSLVHHHGWSRA